MLTGINLYFTCNECVCVWGGGGGGGGGEERESYIIHCMWKLLNSSSQDSVQSAFSAIFLLRIEKRL